MIRVSIKSYNIRTNYTFNSKQAFVLSNVYTLRSTLLLNLDIGSMLKWTGNTALLRTSEGTLGAVNR